MRYLNLWQTELPPVIDVTVGPINSESRVQRKPCLTRGQAEPKALLVAREKYPSGQDSINGAAPNAGRAHENLGTAGSATADAAPPEPTPADLEGAHTVMTHSQECPGTEREGGAWVPWEGGECPVPELQRVDVRLRNGMICANVRAFMYKWVCPNGNRVYAYRFANPRHVPPKEAA